MAVFIGNALNNTANAPGGVLFGFVGGNLAQLQDAFSDTIVGLGGNDFIVAGNAGDIINGGDGNDFIDGRGGLDVMDGGNGIDTMDVSFFGFSYIWDMATGITNFSPGGEFAFNFENARTGAGADRITGNAANNNISLGAGNDFATGADGNDQVFGGLGNDNLFGGNGNDLLLGEAGTDVLSGGDGFDNLQGGLDNDRLDGGAANDTLFGGAGNDAVFGGLGNDFLLGDAGLDFLSGGDGFDNLQGGLDNDRLLGGLNNDILTGGGGFDRFRFDTVPNGVANFDRILDFNSFFDTIELENAFYAGLPGGALSPFAFKVNGPLDPTDRVIYTPGNGNLFFDPDGSGFAPSVRFAQVNPGTAVSFTDFFVT